MNAKQGIRFPPILNSRESALSSRILVSVLKVWLPLACTPTTTTLKESNLYRGRYLIITSFLLVRITGGAASWRWSWSMWVMKHRDGRGLRSGVRCMCCFTSFLEQVPEGRAGSLLFSWLLAHLRCRQVLTRCNMLESLQCKERRRRIRNLTKACLSPRMNSLTDSRYHKRQCLLYWDVCFPPSIRRWNWGISAVS